MSRLFGTDGVRGVVNAFLTPELAYHLGRAAGSLFRPSKETSRIPYRARHSYFRGYA